MSKLEAPMTLDYWEIVGGLLVEEYMVVPPSATQGRRCVDGLIVPERRRQRVEATRARSLGPATFAGEDVIVVQTKRCRLGMDLGGQAIFSPELVRQRLNPRSVQSVALCSATDSEIEPLLTRRGVKVVALDGYPAPPEPKKPASSLLGGYWRKMGGTLARNFPIVAGSKTSAAHYAEAIVIPHGERRELLGEQVSLEDQDVIVVSSRGIKKKGVLQNRLGMAVMGRALLSLELLRQHHGPRSARAIALVPRDDSVMRALCRIVGDLEPEVIS